MASAAGLPRAILLDPVDNGLGLGRPLRRRGVEIHMLTGTGWSRCFSRSRGVHGWELRDPPAGEDDWIDCLNRLAEDGDGVLIPCTDPESEMLVKRRSDISPRLRSFEAPGRGHLELMDKASMTEIARRAGVRAPWSIEVRSGEDLERALDEATYPCVLKPALSHLWRVKIGIERVLLVHGPDELRQIAREPLDAGLELLVTEYVPGPETNVEEATLIRAEDGSYPLLFGARKLRQYPVGFGAGGLIVSEPVPETVEIAKRLVDAAGLVGFANVEAKRHADTGEVVLIEANVRTSQCISIGNACGVDAAWRIYASIAGIPLPPQPPQRNGVKVVIPMNEWRAVSRGLRSGDLRLGKLIASYRGVRDVGMFDPRDPGPLLGYALESFRYRREQRRGRAAR